MRPYVFCTKAVERAGALLLRRMHTPFAVGTKHHDPRDIVTAVDIEINTMLTRAIRNAFPDHALYSEETGETARRPYTWIIDPIDGSSNFSRRIPHFAICLGLLHKMVPIVGAVYNPVTRELFSFEKGRGAYVNSVRIKPSSVRTLENAYVFLRAGRTKESWGWGATTYRALLSRVKKTNNFGSSSLDTCFVAAGRIEANIYGTLTTMDIAPALGILVEAGGIAVDGNGKPIALSTTPQKVIMTNNRIILRALMKIV